MFTKHELPAFHEILKDFENQSPISLNTPTFTKRLAAIHYPLNKIPSLFLDNVHMTLINKPIVYGVSLDHAIDYMTFKELLEKNNQNDLILKQIQETVLTQRLQKHNLEEALTIHLEHFVSSLENIHKIEHAIFDAMNDFADFTNSEEIKSLDKLNKDTVIREQKMQLEENILPMKLNLIAALEHFIQDVEKIIQLEINRTTEEKQNEFEEIIRQEKLLLKALSEEISPIPTKKEGLSSSLTIFKLSYTSFKLSNASPAIYLSVMELLKQKFDTETKIDKQKIQHHH